MLVVVDQGHRLFHAGEASREIQPDTDDPKTGAKDNNSGSGWNHITGGIDHWGVDCNGVTRATLLIQMADVFSLRVIELLIAQSITVEVIKQGLNPYLHINVVLV